jgi:hypothetical protein
VEPAVLHASRDRAEPILNVQTIHAAMIGEAESGVSLKPEPQKGRSQKPPLILLRASIERPLTSGHRSVRAEARSDPGPQSI